MVLGQNQLATDAWSVMPRRTVSLSRTTECFSSVPRDSHGVRNDLNWFPLREASWHRPCSIWARARKPSVCGHPDYVENRGRARTHAYQLPETAGPDTERGAAVPAGPGAVAKGRLPVVGSRLAVFRQMARLEHFLPLTQKVIRQTKERVVFGKEAEEKVLSLFEPYTQVIRKGKAHKPNEFGRLVRIDEVENGIVCGFEVVPGNR